MDNNRLTYVKQPTITHDLPAIFSFIKYTVRLSTNDKKSKDHPLIFCGIEARDKRPVAPHVIYWFDIIAKDDIPITKPFALAV